MPETFRSIRKAAGAIVLALAAAFAAPAALANPVVPPGCYVLYDENGDCLVVVCPWDQSSPFRPCDGGV